MLNAGFDDDSGSAVCLSTGVLGVVEVVFCRSCIL